MGFLSTEGVATCPSGILWDREKSILAPSRVYTTNRLSQVNQHSHATAPTRSTMAAITATQYKILRVR